MYSYLACYCLYRDKYTFKDGIKDEGHTSIFMGKEKENSSFKWFLKDTIEKLIVYLAKEIKSLEEKNKIPEINVHVTNIKGLLQLGEMFGLGYKTKGIVGKNYNIFAPIDFGQKIEKSPYLKNINFIVKHNPYSPLWKSWFVYHGKFWRKKKENKQIFLGHGPLWKKFNSEPKAWLNFVGLQYSKLFWSDYFSFLKCFNKDRSKNKQLNKFLKEMRINKCQK
jgi:hypothetical protein